jgi:hypothetical protein
VFRLRKLFNIIFTVAIISALIIPCLAVNGLVSTAEVSGSISSDTTWTQTGSPYTLNTSVTVANGVTLTIEAGVTVNLNGNTLQVNGILHAVGSNTYKVLFNNGNIVFSSSSVGWDDQSGTGDIIQSATLNQVLVSSINAVKVSGTTINAPDDASAGALSIGGFSIITDNMIISTSGKGYGVIVKNGLASIQGNIISGFAVGVWASSPASLQQNSILNCGVGLGIGKIIGTSFDNYEFGEVSVTVTENTFAKNYIAIGGPIFSGKVPISNVVATGEVTGTRNFIDNNTYGLALGALGSFRYNTISNSETAVTIYDTSGSLSPHFDSNNIIAYQQSVNQLGPKDVWMEENYWGTTDLQAINASIHDKIDNPVLGRIYFGGASSSRYAEAPAQPPTPVPDLPTPEWSPTDLPSESPSPTPTGNANNYFQVESNSSITELFFNSTSSELSFTVSGPAGTTGYVQYKIAKSLLSSVQNVKVYLDGSQLNVNISSDQDSWLLYFTYHHSSHKVLIDLSQQGSVAPESTWVIWIAVPVIAAVLLIAGVALKRRKTNQPPIS